MQQDYLFYGTDLQTRYAYRMVHLSTLVENARNLHSLNEARSVVLGEVLLSGVLLSSLLEDEERVNLRFQLGSDFTVVSETTRHAETKGYIHCFESSEVVERLDQGFGFDGDLYVRSLRSQVGTGKLFEGVTNSQTSSIQNALNEHLKQSYQMRAGARLQAWIDPDDRKLRAFGAIFLELPKLEHSASERLWRHVESLPPMKQLYAESDDPDVLAGRLIPDATRAINSVIPKWSCTCSFEAVENMFRRLPVEELVDIVDRDESPTVKCQYCSKIYTLSVAQIKEFVAGRQDLGASNP